VDLAVVWENLPKLVHGALTTLELTVVSVSIGLCIAVPLALMRVSANPLLRLPVHGFIFYFRGTPLLVQIFLIYYGSGQFQQILSQIGLWGLFREAHFCAILSLTLNTAAYTAEILRGAIEAVPRGEIEAARACGMSGTLLYRRIVLPIALRFAWPAYTNEVVFLLQATSLVSIITIMDITGATRLLAARYFAFYELFISAAIFYLLLVYGILFAFRKIERRIMKHLAAYAVELESDKGSQPA
jgi:His/Glu/Gln/Arg/opine family amino acid ABC transporter permease subunit